MSVKSKPIVGHCMLIACSLLHACNFLLGHGIIKPLDMTLHSSGLPFKHSRIEERVFST